MEKRKVVKATFNTNTSIVYGFLLALVIGTILLMTPFASASGKGTDVITALFTATTSICVTGLVVVPTYVYWSLFGKVVILLLIQLGGLGIISFTVGFLMLLGRKISLKERKVLQESYNLDSAQGVIKTLRKIFGLTFTIEGIGAALFAFQFVPEYGVAKGIWYSVFHSISAFCNAGIDVLGPDSFIKYQGNILVNLTTIMLIVSGGIGFIVWLDFRKLILGIKSKDIHPRKVIERMSLHSKVALITTAILIAGGLLVVMVLEYSNPETIGEFSFGKKILTSLFESVTLRTAGFATISQCGFRNATFIILCIFMFIGGSPLGTAGGVKTTTVAMLYVFTMSTIKGKDDVEICKRRVNINVVRNAIAIIMIVFSILIAAIMVLSFTEDAPMKTIVFEAFSAMGTVGLSMDFTASLSTIGRIIIIVLMFFGRVGPITIAMAISSRARRDKTIRNYPEKRVLVG